MEFVPNFDYELVERRKRYSEVLGHAKSVVCAFDKFHSEENKLQKNIEISVK